MDCVDLAKSVVSKEIRGLEALIHRFEHVLEKAVDLILSNEGKVVISGMGKSGHIAKKISSTFNSIGIQSVFLHPAEGVHGDLGIYKPGDPTILISKSGCSEEVVKLIPILKNFNSPIISIIGRTDSVIGKDSDVVLDASVEIEADPLGFVPTTSAMVALAWGDVLASVLMLKRNFGAEDFLKLHPSGQLGRNISLCVKDVMHDICNVAVVGPEYSLREIVIAMTEKALGAALVLDDKKFLKGIVTDGDVRRLLVKEDNVACIQAKDFMKKQPLTINCNSSLQDAVNLMEGRPSQISVLPVVSDVGICLGLLRLHDIYQPYFS